MSDLIGMIATGVVVVVVIFVWFIGVTGRMGIRAGYREFNKALGTKFLQYKCDKCKHTQTGIRCEVEICDSCGNKMNIDEIVATC